MNIKPRGLIGDPVTATESDEAVVRVRQEQAQKNNSAKNATVLLQKEDTVSIELARSISTELNPDAIASERRKKIEELKTLIAAGKYNPTSEAIAERVAEEISLEILGAGGNR